MVNIVPVRVGDTWLEVAIDQVLGSQALRDLTPVPGAPAWFMGLTPRDGAALAVVDPRFDRDDGPIDAEAATRVLVVQTGRQRFGIACVQVAAPRPRTTAPLDLEALLEEACSRIASAAESR